jgi:hypothetical protein
MLMGCNIKWVSKYYERPTALSHFHLQTYNYSILVTGKLFTQQAVCHGHHTLMQSRQQVVGYLLQSEGGKKWRKWISWRNWRREERTAKTNKVDKEAEFLWTCYAIKRYGKINDVGELRRQEKIRKIKKWMDEIQERTEMNLVELRDTAVDRKAGEESSWRSLELNKLTAQGNK